MIVDLPVALKFVATPSALNLAMTSSSKGDSGSVAT
jgi:hypothetical protein